MVKTFAKRNHYNPCFWTALWNRDYFDAWIAGRHADRVAREQTVFALNLRSDKVRRTKVAEVHYEKNLGVAEITPESMKQFCKRWFPQEYRRLSRYVARNPETLYMDFEDILAGIENRGIYSSLMKAAKIGEVDSAEHKGFLVSALVTHAMRSHEFMTSMVGGAHNIGLEKWEYFWLLKNAWGNPLTLARAVIPLAMGQWTFYRAAGHRFPLCDSPIMIRRDTLMAVLSPRLVLKISLNVRQREDHWIVKENLIVLSPKELR